MLIATEGGGLKSRAFTLIELLAVIIIIGVITLITTPVIIGVINKIERGAFERSIGGLLETVRLDYSTDSFLSPREYYYEGKDLILLTVAEETKDESIGMKGKIDGKGFIYIDEEGIIHIENICSKKYCASGEENRIEITENESGVIPEVGKNDPIIRLVGEKTIYVNLNETYEEPGVVAKTKSGKELEYTSEITVNGEIVTNIDTSVENTYVITYKTSNEGKEVSVTRNIVVLDMKPEITMTEPNESAVTSKEVLITVSGIIPNTVTGFTYEIKVNGESIKTETVAGTKTTIVLETDGINEIKVTATDNNSHTNTATKTYKIDRTGPVITVNPKEVTLESESVQDYDILTGVSVRDEHEGEIETSRIEIGGDPLLKIPGRYEVIYTVRDNLGNETTESRIFIVEDKTKPEITITPEETTKYMQSQVITIEASDNIRVDEIKYVIIKNNVRGTEQTITNGGSITFNETGDYQIEVTAKDSSNNISTKMSKVYQIDTVPPEITFKRDITLTANEVAGFNLMEDKTVEVRDNSGEEVTLQVTGELNTIVGEKYITYTAIDQAGNKTEKVRTILIEKAIGPVFNYGSASSNGIWTKGRSIGITATIMIENDELTSFSYQVDNGTEVNVQIKDKKSMGTEVALDTTGKHTITMKAKGKHDNEKSETIGEFWIDIDKPTAPTTMNFVYWNWTVYPDNTWTNQSIGAGRTADDPAPTGSTDVGSGVEKYQISDDNIKWEDFEYKATEDDSMYTMVSDGIHTRYFRAVDKAGNVSEPISRTAKIDKTPPTPPTTMNFVYWDWSVYPDSTWTNQVVNAGRTKEDPGPTGSTDGNGSGVAKYQISKDNEIWEDIDYYSYTDMYSMSSEGIHTRYFRAVDNVGNVSTSISRTAKIDKTPPTGKTAGLAWTDDPTWANIYALILDTGNNQLYGMVKKDDSSQPSCSSADWVPIPTYTDKSNLYYTVRQNGTYYVWGKDSACNISSPLEVVVSSFSS